MQAASARATLAGVAQPFPGLRPFEDHEEPVFRGRRQHTDELLRRLSTHRFLAVVGTSGSGKSSLVRAGLLPALDRGYLAGATSNWRIAVMRPGMAPIENLAAALRDPNALGPSANSNLRSSRLGLVEMVRGAGLTAGESLLLVADQFEELFRFERRSSATDGGADAALFVSLLLTAAARLDAPVYIVLTMRSDFLGDCARFAGLPEALSESQYLIPRLTREQRRQAIEEPLRLFGAAMTPQLVQQLLNDSGDEADDTLGGALYRGGAPDPLPVLQHALMRTYQFWQARGGQAAGEPIGLDDYRQAGRMESALNHHAEKLFTKDLDSATQAFAQRIFRCLTTTELGRPVRRPTRRDALYKVVGAASDSQQAQAGQVLEVLGRPENSFVHTYPDGTVDISHESLIWKWKRLSGWVSTEASSAELYRDLAKDAGGQATWGEPKLSAAIAVRKRDAWNADWADQYAAGQFHAVQAFLARSRRAVWSQRLVRVFAVIGLVAVVIATAIAWYATRDAHQQKSENDALKVVQNGLTAELANQKQQQDAIEKRIQGLSASDGAEKARLLAELSKSQNDSKALAEQASTSTDLVASVKSLQARLDQAQQDLTSATLARGAEASARKDAEAKVAQLQAQVASLTKDLAAARAPATAPPARPAAETAPPAPANLQGSVAAVTPPAPAVRILRLHQGDITTVAWSRNGRMLASGGFDDMVLVWDAEKGVALSHLDIHEVVNSVDWSPDGKTLAVGGADSNVRFWDITKSKIVRVLQGAEGFIGSVAWSPNGQTLAAGGKDGVLRLWNAATGASRRLDGNKDSIECVAWSPDGTMVASAGADNKVRIWDAARERLLHTMPDHRGLALSVAWSPDGKTLASSGADKTVRLWNTATGQLLWTAHGHEKSVNSVAFSPDGKTLASASDDATVRFWNPATGASQRIQQGSVGSVVILAWSPDGRTLASAGADQTVRLWPVP